MYTYTDTATFSNDSSFLLGELLKIQFFGGDDEVEIGLISEGNVWSTKLAWDDFDTEKELSIRLASDGHFYIYHHYYQEVAFKRFYHKLTQDQISMIPEGLINKMKGALEAKEPIRISKNALNSSRK